MPGSGSLADKAMAAWVAQTGAKGSLADLAFLAAATPVVKSAAIASPTSDTVGTKTAIDAIRAALIAAGITL